jgi:tripartite ATP-independent transporter DctM subunit
MLKAGYDQKLSSGVIAAGGTLGILIPPSILLIVYSATASVSVVKMYAAALIPGFLLAGLYVVYVITRAVLNPSLCPKPKDLRHYSVLESLALMLQAFVPLAALILAVLGSILFGLATPSEAAAMGALGGIILAVVYRAFSWDRLRESVYLTARTSAMVCFLFVGSATFASVFSYLGGEHIVKDIMLGMNLSPLQFLILAQLIIFLLGWPLEWSEIIIIFVPIFLPLLPLFGIDPLFFGVLVALNLQTAFLTPPMAMSAYYLKGIAPPQVQLGEVFRGCLPFVALVLVCMVLMYQFPQIVFYLPELFYGS